MLTQLRRLKNKIRPPRQSYALNQLDWKLEPYINYKNGFFIEAGANNGIKQSNTLFFEQYKQWTGLLIEPIPDLAEQCRQNRPNCIVENYALVASDYEETSIEIQFANLMSVVKGGMKSQDEIDEHIQKGISIQGIESSYTMSVPVSTLSEILERHHIQQIDLLSLDVEGYELSVLKGLDFSKHQPKFMLVESNYRLDIINYLKELYDPIAEISHHDILFKLRTNI